MGRIIPRRWIRRTGEAAGQIREFPAVARLKRAIALLLAEAGERHRGPYHQRLAEAVSGTRRAAPLEEVARTLRAVDLAELDLPSRPLVSVVMPVRNRAGVVADAVGSALAQTYAEFELLICDDASTDGTADVLDGFADPRIRRLASPDHAGAAAGRNRCLRHARGVGIAYLDSDNLWHPRFLEYAMASLWGDPAYSAAFASFLDLRLDAKGRSALTHARVAPFDLAAQIDAPFVDLNSFVHRRALTEALGGFDERLVRRQDYDLILRYCWTKPPLHIPYALNLYRRAAHLDQITQVQGEDNSAAEIVAANIAAYRENGGPAGL